MCKNQRLVLQNELQKELRLADDLATVKFWSKQVIKEIESWYR